MTEEQQLEVLEKMRELLWQHLGAAKPFGKILKAICRSEDFLYSKIGRRWPMSQRENVRRNLDESESRRSKNA